MQRLHQATKPWEVSDAESFVRAHQAGVWRYLRLLGASPADADDLLQDTFLRCLRQAGPQRAEVAVLRTIARGLWIDRHRWLQRRGAVQWADELDSALEAAPDSDHELWLDALDVCRSKLSDRARRALELAYRDGCGRREVASELGLAPNTVRNLLATTREVLRQCIEKRIRDSEGAER